MNTKAKKGILVKESQYSAVYVWIIYATAIFVVVFMSFLMAKYVVSYSIQMQMLQNKLYSLKSQELILNEQLHDVNAQINKLYFQHSSVIYIGDKAFSIFKPNK